MNRKKRLTHIIIATTFSLVTAGKAHGEPRPFDLEGSNLKNDGFLTNFTFSMDDLGMLGKLGLLNAKKLRIEFDYADQPCPVVDINTLPYLMFEKEKIGKKVVIHVTAETSNNDYTNVSKALCLDTPNLTKNTLRKLNDLQEAGGWMIVENGKVSKDSLTPG